MIKMDDIIPKVIAEVRPYTMVPDAGLATTIRLTLDAITKGIPGDVVECGTWKGGASFAMLLAQRYAYGEIKRPVWMYDSFQGMSPPHAKDGDHAQWWRQRSLSGIPDPDNQNFCVAAQAEVREAAARLGLTDHVMIHAGWFHETVPHIKSAQIAVLRIDCDWYEPCKLVYRELAPLVSVGGPIIIDDYMAWEGCVLATHEYLSTNNLPWMIQTADGACGAYMIKSPATW